MVQDSKREGLGKRGKMLICCTALLMFLAVGCGGGGGGGNSAPPDTTPPTISSTSPLDGATGVAPYSPITVSFSEAMDSATITTSTFTLADINNPINGAVTSTGTTATFTPNFALTPFTSYSSTITTGAKDSAGNAIAATYKWGFTTGGAAGSLDTTFGTSGKVTTAIGSSTDVSNAMAIQSDGKIVVAGKSWNGTNDDFALARYNADGSLDTTFSSDGMVTTAIGTSTDLAKAVAVQSDGRIVVAGYSDNATIYNFALVRYNTNGTLDTSFGTSNTGIVTTAIGTGGDKANAIAIQSDGKIVVAGHSDIGSQDGFALVRYNTNGTLDTSFGTGGKVTTTIGVSDIANAMTIQSDGRIVVAGYSSPIGSIYEFALARYNTDGILDTSFGTSNTGIVTTGGEKAYAVAIQSDGKIVVAGESNNDFAVVRYNTDGTLDTTFDTDGKVTTTGTYIVDAVAIQSDGKIIAAGDNASDFELVRYWP